MFILLAFWRLPRAWFTHLPPASWRCQHCLLLYCVCYPFTTHALRCYYPAQPHLRCLLCVVDVWLRCYPTLFITTVVALIDLILHRDVDWLLPYFVHCVVLPVTLVVDLLRYVVLPCWRCDVVALLIVPVTPRWLLLPPTTHASLYPTPPPVVVWYPLLIADYPLIDMPARCSLLPWRCTLPVPLIGTFAYCVTTPV